MDNGNGIAPAISLLAVLTGKKHAVEGNRVVTKSFFSPEFDYDNLDDAQFMAIEAELVAFQARLLEILKHKAF